jgi:hypothetical protein
MEQEQEAWLDSVHAHHPCLIPAFLDKWPHFLPLPRASFTQLEKVTRVTLRTGRLRKLSSLNLLVMKLWEGLWPGLGPSLSQPLWAEE